MKPKPDMNDWVRTRPAAKHVGVDDAQFMKLVLLHGVRYRGEVGQFVRFFGPDVERLRCMLEANRSRPREMATAV